MDEIQLKEIREGMGCPDVEGLKPPPLSLGRRDGSVTMETREEEERRWRQRYPEIKKCVILIKKLFKEEKEEEGLRSGDPEVDYDWMEPLKPQVIRRSRVRRFVKRMEFSANVCNGKPRGRGRGRGLLKLRCCTGEDGVHIGPRQRSKGQVTKKPHKNSIILSETEHGYSSQSQDSRPSATCGQTERKPTKKKPPKIVFRKVAGKKWVLGRSKVKKQQVEEEEVVGGRGITTENKKRKKRQNSCGQCAACLKENCGKCPFCLDQKKFGGVERRKQRCINRRCLAAAKKWVVEMSKVKKRQPKEEKVVGSSGITTGNNKRKKRQNSCGQCAACLRENCGKCPFCLDKKKFGGAERQKQRCINRRCLVRLRTKKVPAWMETAKGVEEEMVTTTTKRQQPNSRKRKCQKTKGKKNKEEEMEEEEEEEEEEEKMWIKPWWLKRRGKRCQREFKEEEEEEEKQTPPATVQPIQEEKMWMKPWWLKRRGKRCQREFKEEEEKQTPPATVQPIQEESVLHLSTGLTYIPPPPPAPSPTPLHPLSPLPKEEKEEVDIDACMMMGDGTGWEQEGIVKEEVKGELEELEELLYTEDIWEQENFYDIEVQLQESDEETVTCPSDMDDNNGQVMTFDPEYEPPESISMWSSSLGPLGEDSSDDVTCGRGWLQLLKVLWTTVLPAHWVVVVAEGPELQLLQCSRLSSMANTIVHIRSDLCFFITVKARRLPDTHMLYETHKWTITHVHRLVSLLLHLEGLVVCPGSSPSCHLLLTPPTLICVPCLFQDADEEGSTDEQ